MAGSLEYRHDNGAVFELTLPRAVEQVSIGLVEDANLSM
jgi:hypothetical protein